MATIESYINDVLYNIQAAAEVKERFAYDLRAHIQEALQAGEPLADILERMGTPAEVAAGFMAEQPLQYAVPGNRLAAYILDLCVLIITAGALAGIGVGIGNLTPQHPAGITTALGAVTITFAALFCLGALGIILLYFPILEGRFGQTAGKHILHLRVLKENGLPVGYKEAFLRRLAFYFKFFPIDAAFVLFTEKKQRAMDIVARTVVIQEANKAKGE
jgi:uncharacterized RDD family membrane protein YckC